jgi:hypothetical protein
MIEQMVLAKRYPMEEEKPQVLEEPSVATESLPENV